MNILHKKFFILSIIFSVSCNKNLHKLSKRKDKVAEIKSEIYFKFKDSYIDKYNLKDIFFECYDSMLNNINEKYIIRFIKKSLKNKNLENCLKLQLEFYLWMYYHKFDDKIDYKERVNILDRIDINDLEKEDFLKIFKKAKSKYEKDLKSLYSK